MLVDKPAGVSSHDVVAVARRAFGEQRIGHGGTLDPFATGLLVLLCGRGTRLIQYLNAEPKIYRATVSFGAETDTEDLLGSVTRQAPLPSRESLLAAIPSFLGLIQQVPPAYSAKRVDGKRAYELARAGAELDLAPVAVTINALALGAFVESGSGVQFCELRLSCGGGTYVRSLARDLARAVGSAAHLTALRRDAAGVFNIARAVPLELLQAGRAELLPVIDALEGYPVQPLIPDEITKVSRGIDVEARVAGQFAALVDPASSTAGTTLVAFGERRSSERGDRFQPRVVMREPLADV